MYFDEREMNERILAIYVSNKSVDLSPIRERNVISIFIKFGLKYQNYLILDKIL